MKAVEIRRARTDEELAAVFDLRRRVFVEEQGLFEDTDIDEYDTVAIHLTAWKPPSDVLVGAVRCYPDPGEVGTWWGGRLVVDPAYRVRGVGVLLVRAAVREVQMQNARRFLAYVQQQNISFFNKLGWASIGMPVMKYGHPHQLMEADLSAIPGGRLAEVSHQGVERNGFRKEDLRQPQSRRGGSALAVLRFGGTDFSDRTAAVYDRRVDGLHGCPGH